MSLPRKRKAAREAKQPGAAERDSGFDVPQADNVLRLVNAHPSLFRGKPPKVASDLPLGWYELVDRLCREIETTLGDQTLHLRVIQIKEKLGCLRFYWSWRRSPAISTDILSATGHVRFRTSAKGETAVRIDALVLTAEAESARTCEQCGAPAKLRRSRSGWLRVRCVKHASAA